jgi:hypothetical protein
MTGNFVSEETNRTRSSCAAGIAGDIADERAVNLDRIDRKALEAGK